MVRVKRLRAKRLKDDEVIDLADKVMTATLALGHAMADRQLEASDPLEKTLSVLSGITEAQSHLMEHYLLDEHNIKAKFRIRYEVDIKE